MFEKEVFCVNCFESRAQLPFVLNAVRRGTCPWCKARSQPLYPMHAIADQFRELVKLYPIAKSFDDEPNELLYKEIKQDWPCLFSDSLASSKIFPDFIEALLRAGLDNDEIGDYPGVRELVKPIEPHLHIYFKEILGEHLAGGSFWERFIGPNSPTVSWYDAFLEDMAIDIFPDQSLFRARVWDKNLEREYFSWERMKATPPEKVKPGRSNRVAQRTLYCGSDIETCIAEVRPFKGAGVAVSAVKLQRPVRVIDFSRPIVISCPLLVTDLGWKKQTQRILEFIADLFSRPANPWGSELYYEPTQALCDSLRSAEYDGIKYRSSLGHGVNFAFFDPDVGVPEEPEYYWVNDIVISHSDFEPYDSEHPYAVEYRRNHSRSASSSVS